MEIVYKNRDNLRHRCDAVIHNGIAYLSGVIPKDASADISTQTAQVLAQLDERLAEVGGSKENILYVTIWMKDVDRDVAAFNKLWNEWLVPGRAPARSCIGSTVQRGMLLEVALTIAIDTSEN